MNRIYIPPEYIGDSEITFPAEQGHRVKSVLRLKVGDAVVVFDGLGKEYQVTLVDVKKKIIRASIESMTEINRDAKLEITLVQGLPKSEKMDYIVQKTTELGVKRIIPVITARVVLQLTPRKAQIREERWRKIAISATEQSGRTIIPKIDSVSTFEKGLVESKSCDLRLFFWEEERNISLKSVLNKINQLASVAVIIGPEGGFTKEEAALAKQTEATSVSLGSRLLRTETVPIAALSILLYQFTE